jgi:hypothetical protein
MIRSELTTPHATEIRWKYPLDKELDGKQETREVVETKSGSLDRLIAIAGKPLSDAQRRTETERILSLSHNPEEQDKLEQSRRKDAEQCNAFLHMIPDAFLFEYPGRAPLVFPRYKSTTLNARTCRHSHITNQQKQSAEIRANPRLGFALRKLRPEAPAFP